VEAHVPEARREGVSKVARSDRGFVGVYRKHGTEDRMREARVSEGGDYTWGKKRQAGRLGRGRLVRGRLGRRRLVRGRLGGGRRLWLTTYEV